MQTVRIDADNLGEKYGEDNVPEYVWEQVHQIVWDLFYIANIEYIDITSYNFLEDEDGKVWCVDYEHATQRKSDTPRNWFLAQFLEDPDMREWNPDFA